MASVTTELQRRLTIQLFNETLHLFEDTDEAWVVSYVAEFECIGYRIDTLDGENDNPRDGIRFELEPVGGKEIKTENPAQLDLDELYEQAKQSSPIESSTTTTSSKWPNEQ